MRTTPQTTAVIEALKHFGHATNATLLSAIQEEFPDISATTVHRITKRLVDEKRIGQLRSPLDGSMLFDANPSPHYHFGCQPCGQVHDIELSPAVVAEIQEAVGKKLLTDTLSIIGVRADCPRLQK